MNIITATRLARKTDGYTLFATGRVSTSDVYGAEAAAAWLLQQASIAGRNYIISAPAEVMALIPSQLRTAQ